MKPRVVIIGGNLAGIQAARHLSCRHFDVTVIDPTPHIEWKPNLHEIISQRKLPKDLRLSRADVLARLGHRFIETRATRIDRQRQVVQLAWGDSVPYDYAIVAVGGAPGNSCIPGMSKHALPLKSVADAHDIHTALFRLSTLRERQSIAVVGAGLEGLELLGEIVRRFRDRFVLHVIDADANALIAHPRLQARVGDAFDGVEMHYHLGQRVHRVNPHGVDLEDGTHLTTRLTLWCAGLEPSPLLAASGLAEPRQWARVNEFLQHADDPRLFVIGDAAELPKPLAKQAYHALAMGEHAAGNLKHLIHQQPLRPFRAPVKPQLATVGDRDAFLFSGPITVMSPLLAPIREAVYQWYFHGLQPPRSLKEARQLVGDLHLGLSRSLRDYAREPARLVNDVRRSALARERITPST